MPYDPKFLQLTRHERHPRSHPRILRWPMPLLWGILLYLVALPSTVQPCDPNSISIEIAQIVAHPLLNPAPLLAAQEILRASSFSAFPQKWVELSSHPGVTPSSTPVDALLFTAGFALWRLFSPHWSPLAVNGRAQIGFGPLRAGLFFKTDRTRFLQSLVLVMSLPGVSRVCWQDQQGNITFIDEVDSTTNLSLGCSWPFLFPKHFRVWNHHGLLVNWGQTGVMNE